MKLQPFTSVNGVPFSVSREEVLRVRGQPVREGRSDVGLNEFDYEDMVFRFQDCGRLEEVTAQAPVLNLGTVAVPFGSLERFIQGTDPCAFERAGFVVSPMFGLAFDPQCPSWVTALAEHCIAEWQAL
jgi:hypothetical protein